MGVGVAAGEGRKILGLGESRDSNSTRRCGYPRVSNPTGAGTDPIFHPREDPHLCIAGAGAYLKFHPQVDLHPPENKETLAQSA